MPDLHPSCVHCAGIGRTIRCLGQADLDDDCISCGGTGRTEPERRGPIPRTALGAALPASVLARRSTSTDHAFAAVVRGRKGATGA